VAATARREELDDAHGIHELVAGLGALGRVTEIALPPLSAAETAVLAERLAGRRLDAARLFAETEGNPLFVVETVRAGALGSRVQAVIAARLAQRSEPARRLAAVAAALGRDFTTDVLARAGGSGERELVRALDELWRRRIVRDRGPEAYDFTHERLREVAYQSLAPAERSRTHLRIARALPAHDHARLAYHCARAAARDHHRAGRAAGNGRGLCVAAPGRRAPARASAGAGARRRSRAAAAALAGDHERGRRRRRCLAPLRPAAARPGNRRRRPGPDRRG
jgi:hypothetical protein